MSGEHRSIPTADDSDLATKYAFQVRKVAEYLESSSIYSYRELSDHAGVKEPALRQFMARNIDRPKYSQTLHKLYIFIATKLDASIIKDRDIFVMVNEIKAARNIVESDSISVFRRLADHMETSFNRINRFGSNFNGTFYMYRYSIVHGKNEVGDEDARIVKTKLVIVEDAVMEKMWRFAHIYKDVAGVERVTYGAIFVLISTVYCFGKIGNGLGLEVIAFREPAAPPDQQTITQALVMTIDTRYQPLVSRAIIKYAGNNEEQCFGTFDAYNIEEEIRDFRKYMENPKDRDRSTGLNLF